MLKAKEISDMYAEYQSLHWLVTKYESRVTASGFTAEGKGDIKPKVLDQAGASGLWHSPRRKYIEDQCEHAFIQAVGVAIKDLEAKFISLGISISE